MSRQGVGGPTSIGGPPWELVLAWHKDGVVDHVKLDDRQREVGEGNLLACDGDLVAIGADKLGREVLVHCQGPELELLSGDVRLELGAGDLVEQPVGFPGLGDVAGTIGVDDVANQAVAIELFGAGELGEIRVCERFGHGWGVLSWRSRADRGP